MDSTLSNSPKRSFGNETRKGIITSKNATPSPDFGLQSNIDKIVGKYNKNTGQKFGKGERSLDATFGIKNSLMTPGVGSYRGSFSEFSGIV